jgi:hypothetical protein
MHRPVTKRGTRRRLLFTAVLAAASLAAPLAAVPAPAALAATVEDKTSFSVTAGSLSFSTTPAMPTLTSVTLNGEAQKTNTTMTNFGVSDATGSGSGWNVTVNGQSGSEKSAVFAQYCPNATCGTDVKGYVPSGATLAANSLTLNSTGASFVAQKESTGTGPELKCATACNVDSATAVKIASAAVNAGMGTWLAEKWSASSLTLSTPTTLKALSNGEIFRVNLLWTLSTGP